MKGDRAFLYLPENYMLPWSTSCNKAIRIEFKFDLHAKSKISTNGPGERIMIRWVLFHTLSSNTRKIRNL